MQRLLASFLTSCVATWPHGQLNSSFRARFADDEDQTSVTDALNYQIRASDDPSNLYTGGMGVLVRNPFDGYQDSADFLVVPASFWSNDISAPSQMFPSTSGAADGWGITSYNPDCPNTGYNGYWNLFKAAECKPDPGNKDETSPWNYAGMGYVVGSAMWDLFYDFDSIQSPDWGYGVFYATDANSVDFRCRYMPDTNNYNCGPDPNGAWKGGHIDIEGAYANQWVEDNTTKGTGAFPPGNPWVYGENGGGGTGCHFDKRGYMLIDQTDAFDGDKGITQDLSCQCNYDFKSANDWEGWVDQWMAKATPKAGLQDENFFQNGKKAPNRALDQVACWVNNPRDMIHIQNWIYWKRDQWCNQMAPKSNWASNDPADIRRYWGWNEMPVSRENITNAQNWDAVVIKLPAAICGHNPIQPTDGGADSIDCLSDGAKIALERDIKRWVDAGYLKPGWDNVGLRPGSYVVIVREWMDENNNWFRWFFCQEWTSPNKMWHIGFNPMSSSDAYGACFIEKGTSLNDKDVLVV